MLFSMTSTGKSSYQQPMIYEDQLAILEREVLSAPSIARQKLIQLVRHLEQEGDLACQAKAICLLAGCDFFESKYSSTIRYANEALKLSRLAGDQVIESRSLNALGLAHQRLDHIEESLELFAQSLTLAELRADSLGRCRALNNMSTVYVQTGDYVGAIEIANESLQIAEEKQFSAAYADAICVLGEAHSYLGAHHVVLDLAEEVLKLLKNEHLYRYECYFGLFYVRALLHTQQIDEAKKVALRNFEISRKIDNFESQCTVMLSLGWIYAEEDKFELSIKYLEQALQSAIRIENKCLISNIYSSISEVLEKKGDHQNALKYARLYFKRERESHIRDLDYRSGAIAAKAKIDILCKEAEMEKLRNEELAEANEKLKNTQKELEYQASHDSLTGLTSRAYFLEKVQKDIESLAINEKRGLIFIDLDQFKEINDSQGHCVGDFVLKKVAQYLSDAVSSDDLVGRMGGDEFIVLLRDIKSEESLIKKMDGILEAIRQPIDYDGRRIAVTASIGYTIFPDDGDDLETLQRHVDLAMYNVKRSGRNGIKRFHAKMSSFEKERRELREDLYVAVEKKHLHLNYQGIFKIANQKIVGFEALCRWTHPEKGPISPSIFVAIAEEDDQLILDMGQFVLREACQYAGENNFEKRNLFISINVSSIQFDRPDFVDTVKYALDYAQINGRCLILELTESMVLQDPELANEHICELNKLGVRVAMDDFGTGYSSLSMLNSLPFAHLKVDRSFIRSLSQKTKKSDRSYLIIKVMIDLAHSLDMLVVAEGVETEDQCGLLSDMGCDKAQGFLLSKPLMPEEAIGIIDHGQNHLRALN